MDERKVPEHYAVSKVGPGRAPDLRVVRLTCEPPSSRFVANAGARIERNLAAALGLTASATVGAPGTGAAAARIVDQRVSAHWVERHSHERGAARERLGDRRRHGPAADPGGPLVGQRHRWIRIARLAE